MVTSAVVPKHRGNNGNGWKPGKSGNPAGRRPGSTLVDLVRARTKDGKIPLDFLVQVCQGKVPEAKVADRVAAANSLLDRAWGRPVQAVAHGGPDGGPIPVALGISDMSDAELVEFIRRGMRSFVVEGAAVAIADGGEKPP